MRTNPTPQPTEPEVPGWSGPSDGSAPTRRTTRRTVSLLGALIAVLVTGAFAGGVGLVGGFVAGTELEPEADCSYATSADEVLTRARVERGSLTAAQSCWSHFREFSGWDTTTYEVLLVGPQDAVEEAIADARGGTPVPENEIVVYNGVLEPPEEVGIGETRQDWMNLDDGRWRRQLEWGPNDDGSMTFLLVTMVRHDRDQR
ncbi:MAG: hypothetical protein KF906_07690 [Actinobacteria bacterium]|nr:hypothetical protein [Actinomycetota bacterium]